MFAGSAHDSLKPLMSDAVIVKGKNTYLRSRKAPMHWFKAARFVQPAVGTFGDSSRNVIRAPGVADPKVVCSEMGSSLPKRLSTTV
jgi:hypothetical protein